MGKMDPVVHFEMPYDDRDRMAEFYKNTFGWKPNMLGPEMENYVTVETSEVDPKTKVPTKPGRIGGGFFKKTPDHEHASVVIAVDDIHEAMKNVETHGGKVIGASKPGEPDNIPSVGWYISFVDTEGNLVSLLQPTGNM